MPQTNADKKTMIDPERPHPERRRSPRFKVQDGVLASTSGILGSILDLSLQGMSFEYYAEDLNDNDPMDIGIFSTRDKTLLTGLQARIIRDQPIVGRNSFLPSLQKKRAVEFINLTDEQRGQLTEILKSQGIGMA